MWSFCFSAGFAGARPVSINIDNVELLCANPYRVSWKADGTRCSFSIVCSYHMQDLGIALCVMSQIHDVYSRQRRSVHAES